MRVLDEIAGKPLILSEKDVDNTLQKIGWNGIIDAVAETFVEEAHGRVISPPKTIMSFSEFESDYRTMPARMEKYPKYVGRKDIGVSSNNPKKGLPLVVGSYTLRNAETLQTLLFFDANVSTAYRTAAASAVGVKELSKFDAKTLGIIGCGQQAYYHIPAVKAIRDIEEIYVTDLDDSKTDKLIDSFDFEIKKMSKRDMFNNLDVMLTMTTAKEPHMFPKDIPLREMMIVSIGADSEIKSEFSPGTLSVVDHFCDSYDQVAHTGTFYQALKNGLISEKDLKSLGSYMVGESELNNSKPVKMFFSTGVALEDLAIAILLHKEFSNKKDSWFQAKP